MQYEQIKNRFTGEIICGGLSLKVVLEQHYKWRRGEKDGSRADLSGANLSGANLYGADLSRADLSRADLSGADLSRAVKAYGYTFTRLPIQLSDKYRIEIWQGFMKIGCEKHLISEWSKFPMKRIIEMDGKPAGDWWKKWKPILLAMAEATDRLELPKQEDVAA